MAAAGSRGNSVSCSVPLEVVFLYSLLHLHGASIIIKRAWPSVLTTSISISKDPRPTIAARLLLAFLQSFPTLDMETSYQPCITDYLNETWQQCTGLTELLPSYSFHCAGNGSASRWLSVSAAYSTCPSPFFFRSSPMKELHSSSVITASCPMKLSSTSSSSNCIALLHFPLLCIQSISQSSRLYIVSTFQLKETIGKPHENAFSRSAWVHLGKSNKLYRCRLPNQYRFLDNPPHYSFAWLLRSRWWLQRRYIFHSLPPSQFFIGVTLLRTHKVT